ncbi:EF-P lysine aminoacylase GenX [Ectothiorhodospiraceae bacterium 2226]|nr:EF-P lysine aminoacylase GenX [Ectothiorhodospiraceae bacterium 2226]
MTVGEDWRPSAPLATLQARARMLAGIRAFFAARDVLEVETPILARTGSPDLHLASLCTDYHGPHGGRLYLQTSPEYHMKRLLAAGSGPIYQVCKVFRDGEAGRLHNPEFTLLEWYRPGFDHHRLMDEVRDLVRALLGPLDEERMTYRAAFQRALDLDPLQAPAAELAATAAAQGIRVQGLEPTETARDAWLDLLLTHCVEPTLGRDTLTFLYEYPASQAALARLAPHDPRVAERFELYLHGVELANGFHELADAEEQGRRFAADNAARAAAGLPRVEPDERLLTALRAGLGDCAGVALGVDRLLMLAVGARALEEVVAFPVARA